jgi:hypothetical protein
VTGFRRPKLNDLGFKPGDSAFVDWKSIMFPSFRLYRHPGENRGPSLFPLTWIPFSNGMTDAVRHLDAGVRRHDELSLRLKARDFNNPKGTLKDDIRGSLSADVGPDRFGRQKRKLFRSFPKS